MLSSGQGLSQLKLSLCDSDDSDLCCLISCFWMSCLTNRKLFYLTNCSAEEIWLNWPALSVFPWQFLSALCKWSLPLCHHNDLCSDSHPGGIRPWIFCLLILAIRLSLTATKCHNPYECLLFAWQRTAALSVWIENLYLAAILVPDSLVYLYSEVVIDVMSANEFEDAGVCTHVFGIRHGMLSLLWSLDLIIWTHLSC